MPSPLLLAALAAVLLAALLRNPESASIAPDARLLFNADFVRSPAPLLWRLVNWSLEPFAAWFELKADRIIAYARLKGCNKFAQPDDYWRRALNALTHAIEVDAPPLSNAGRFMLFEQLSNNLCIQHAISELLERHGPEITSQKIARPIVIAGPPRTGSTFLLSLLSSHPNATAVTYMEAVEPVASTLLRPSQLFSLVDLRLYKVMFATRLVTWLLPSFDSLFGNLKVNGAFEEMQLGAVVFSSTLFVAEMLIPSYSKWLLETDQTPMEAYTKLCLQVIQFQRGQGEKTWILKSPQNAEFLYAKAAVFPDAVHVFTHRNATEVVTSLVPMLAYTSKVFNRPDQDLRAMASFWLQRLKTTGKLLSQSYIDKHVSRDRQVNLAFDFLMRDPLKCAADIFGAARVPLGSEPRKALERYVADSVRQGSVKFKYDLLSFGVSQKEIDDATKILG